MAQAAAVDEGVRAMRVIVGGLVAGLLFFGAIGFLVGPLSPADSQVASLLRIVIAAFAAFAAASYVLMRNALNRDLAARATELRQASDPASLIVVRYRAFLITGAGLIEGPGFMAGIAYLLSHDVLGLLGLGLAVVLLLLHLPSAASLRRLAETTAAQA
jgi:hypothetical protein